MLGASLAWWRSSLSIFRYCQHYKHKHWKIFCLRILKLTAQGCSSPPLMLLMIISMTAFENVRKLGCQVLFVLQIEMKKVISLGVFQNLIHRKFIYACPSSKYNSLFLLGASSAFILARNAAIDFTFTLLTFQKLHPLSRIHIRVFSSQTWVII